MIELRVWEKEVFSMKKIITISREFGSGGRTIGKMVADKLGYAFYDKELIEKVAEQTGFASAAHFRRVFRETMGVGPLQYRKSRK